MGEGLVDVVEDVELFFGVVLVLLVQRNLDGLGTVSTDGGSLSADFRWVDDVFQDRFVNSSQSSGSWAGLSAFASEVGVHDGSLANDNEVLLGELLFQFSDELGHELLGFLVAHVWDGQQDSGLVGTTTWAFNFQSSGELKVLQVQVVGRSGLNVIESLGDFLLQVIWRHPLFLDDLRGHVL